MKGVKISGIIKRSISLSPLVNQGNPIRNAKKAVLVALRKQWQPAGDTFATLAQLYLDAGCPNKRFESRSGEFTHAERIRLSSLTTYFGPHPCDEIRLKLLPAYSVWRMRQVKKGTGARTVDLDLCTLSNVINYGVAIGQLELNWIARNRPRYRKAADVRRSREVMPASADVIHALADVLLADIRSEVTGWLTLFAMFTGCRTSELLRLRLDATAEQAGHLAAGYLHLGRRSKNGTNPYCALGLGPQHEPPRLASLAGSEQKGCEPMNQEFKRCACGNLIVLAHGADECAVCHLKRVGLWDDDDDVDSERDSGQKPVDENRKEIPHGTP